MAKRAVPEGIEPPAVNGEEPKRSRRKAETAQTEAQRQEEAVIAANRRHFGRGWLAQSIEQIFRQAEAGKLKVDGPLTVSKLRSLVQNSAGEQPSTGAVSAVLVRWAEDGYIKVTGKPVSFNGFTAKYTAERGGNLESFLETTKEKRRKERAAVKTA